MKIIRVLCFVLLCATVVSSFGCGDRPVLSLSSFSEQFDLNGFASDLTKHGWQKFEDVVSKYSYNGKPITEQVEGFHMYGPTMTTNASGENFGYSIEYSTRKYEIFADVIGTLWTTVPLEGMTLPYDMEIGDTLEKTFKKIGVDGDPAKKFVPDAEVQNEMTLLADKSSSLVLVKCGNGEKYLYELVYAEKTWVEISNGGKTAVTRTMRFYFEPENLTLGKISIINHEERNLLA